MDFRKAIHPWDCSWANFEGKSVPDRPKNQKDILSDVKTSCVYEGIIQECKESRGA